MQHPSSKATLGTLAEAAQLGKAKGKSESTIFDMVSPIVIRCKMSTLEENRVAPAVDTSPRITSREGRMQHFHMQADEIAQRWYSSHSADLLHSPRSNANMEPPPWDGFPDPASSFYTYSYSHNIFAPPPSIYATLEARHRAEGIDHSPRTAASKAQAVKASESNVASWLGEIASKVGEGIGNALQKQLDRAAHEAEELSSANNARREKQLKQPSLARWCADLERANTQALVTEKVSSLRRRGGDSSGDDGSDRDGCGDCNGKGYAGAHATSPRRLVDLSLAEFNAAVDRHSPLKTLGGQTRDQVAAALREAARQLPRRRRGAGGQEDSTCRSGEKGEGVDACPPQTPPGPKTAADPNTGTVPHGVNCLLKFSPPAEPHAAPAAPVPPITSDPPDLPAPLAPTGSQLAAGEAASPPLSGITCPTVLRTTPIVSPSAAAPTGEGLSPPSPLQRPCARAGSAAGMGSPSQAIAGRRGSADCAPAALPFVQPEAAAPAGRFGRAHRRQNADAPAAGTETERPSRLETASAACPLAAARDREAPAERPVAPAIDRALSAPARADAPAAKAPCVPRGGEAEPEPDLQLRAAESPAVSSAAAADGLPHEAGGGEGEQLAAALLAWLSDNLHLHLESLPCVREAAAAGGPHSAPAGLGRGEVQEEPLLLGDNLLHEGPERNSLYVF